MDQRIKRGGMAAIMASVLGLTAGCSDYPDEGELNTQDVRRNFQIIEITGDVYGVTEDTIEAGQAYIADSDTLDDLPSDIWAAHLADEGIPEFDLQYPNVDGSAVSGVIDRLAEMAQEQEQSVRDRVDEQIAELQANIDHNREVVAESKKNLEAFNEADEVAAAELKTVREKLTKAEKAYNEAFNAPMAEINALLEANGIAKLHPEYGNPLADYYWVDREQGVDGPGCDNRLFDIVVDARKELKKCLIFRKSTNYEAVWDEMRPILLDATVKFEKVAEPLGQKRKFFTAPTGLYAEMEQAEAVYKQARSAAMSKYGQPSQLEYSVKRGERLIEQEQERIESLRADSHIDRLLNQQYLQVDANDRQVIRDYFNSMAADLQSQLEEVSSLELTKDESATFSDIPSGYQGLLVSGEMLLSRGGGRNSGVFTDYVDLTDEAVADADVIEATVSRRGLNHRVRYSSEEDMRNIRVQALLNYLKDMNNG